MKEKNIFKVSSILLISVLTLLMLVGCATEEGEEVSNQRTENQYTENDSVHEDDAHVGTNEGNDESEAPLDSEEPLALFSASAGVDDVYFLVNGNKYYLGISVEDLIDLGDWEPDIFAHQDFGGDLGYIPGNERIINAFLRYLHGNRNDSMNGGFVAVNSGDAWGEFRLTQMRLSRITMININWDGEYIVYELPFGLRFDMTTDEILALLGEPDEMVVRTVEEMIEAYGWNEEDVLHDGPSISLVYTVGANRNIELVMANQYHIHEDGSASEELGFVELRVIS